MALFFAESRHGLLSLLFPFLPLLFCLFFFFSFFSKMFKVIDGLMREGRNGWKINHVPTWIPRKLLTFDKKSHDHALTRLVLPSGTEWWMWETERKWETRGVGPLLRPCLFPDVPRPQRKGTAWSKGVSGLVSYPPASISSPRGQDKMWGLLSDHLQPSR